MCEGVDAAETMVDWETMLRVREPTATSWRFPTKTALYCDFTTKEGDRGRLDLAEGDCDWVTRRVEAGVFERADLLEGVCLVRRDLCGPFLRPGSPARHSCGGRMCCRASGGEPLSVYVATRRVTESSRRLPWFRRRDELVDPFLAVRPAGALKKGGCAPDAVAEERRAKLRRWRRRRWWLTSQAQSIEATPAFWSDSRCSLNASAGVFQPSVFRGRPLSVEATASISSAVHRERSVPLGKYWRSSPLVFSLVPRCHGLCGSAK